MLTTHGAITSASSTIDVAASTAGVGLDASADSPEGEEPGGQLGHNHQAPSERAAGISGSLVHGKQRIPFVLADGTWQKSAEEPKPPPPRPLRRFWKTATHRRGEEFLRNIVADPGPGVGVGAAQDQPGGNAAGAAAASPQAIVTFRLPGEPDDGRANALQAVAATRGGETDARTASASQRRTFSSSWKRQSAHDRLERDFLASLATLNQDTAAMEPVPTHSLGVNAKIFVSNYHRSRAAGGALTGDRRSSNDVAFLTNNLNHPTLITGSELAGLMPADGGHVRLRIAKVNFSSAALADRAFAPSKVVLTVSSVLCHLTDSTQLKLTGVLGIENDGGDPQVSHLLDDGYSVDEMGNMLTQKYRLTKAALEARLRKKGFLIKSAPIQEYFYGHLLRPSLSADDLAPVEELENRERQRRKARERERGREREKEKEKERAREKEKGSMRVAPLAAQAQAQATAPAESTTVFGATTTASASSAEVPTPCGASKTLPAVPSLSTPLQPSASSSLLADSGAAGFPDLTADSKPTGTPQMPAVDSQLALGATQTGSSLEEANQQDAADNRSDGASRMSRCSTDTATSSSGSRFDDEEEEDLNNDAFLLDDPTIKGELRRRLISLPSYISSLIPFSEVRNLEQDINERFWLTHPYLQSLNVQLTHIRKIKAELMLIAMEERSIIDLSTAIYAICYFERLVLKLKISEANRHVAAAACMILAVKFWEGGISSQEIMQRKVRYTLDKLQELWGLARGKILALEFKCYAALEFGLLVPSRFALTHFVRQLGVQNLTPSEYLAKTELLNL